MRTLRRTRWHVQICLSRTVSGSQGSAGAPSRGPPPGASRANLSPAARGSILRFPGGLCKDFLEEVSEEPLGRPRGPRDPGPAARLPARLGRSRPPRREEAYYAPPGRRSSGNPGFPGKVFRLGFELAIELLLDPAIGPGGISRSPRSTPLAREAAAGQRAARSGPAAFLEQRLQGGRCRVRNPSTAGAIRMLGTPRHQ